MKFLLKILAITCSVLFFSCDDDTSSPATSEPIPVKDDFSYLAVTSRGEILKIGNNTGKMRIYTQFGGLKNNTISLSTITSNSKKIFLINHISSHNQLHIFDKKTKITEGEQLVFPSEIKGMEPTITSLVWDESQKLLYGIVVTNPYPYENSPENTCYFIKINPDNFEIKYDGLTFNQTTSSSVYLNNGKVYSSYFNDGFSIEIDLTSNTAKKILYNNTKTPYIKPVAYDDNTAYCFRQEANNRNILTKLNLSSNTYEDVLPNENFYSYPPFGNGFIDKLNNQYICFMTDSQQLQILKYNISTKIFSILKVIPDTSNESDLLIIDKIDN